MRTPLIPAVVLLASASLIALSGCSAPAESGDQARPTSSASQPSRTPSAAPSDDGHSLEEACQIANEAAMSVQTEASEALANPSDPAVVATALEAVETRLGEALTEITNPEVEAATAEVQGHFARLSDLFAGIQAGTATQEQVAELQGAVQEMQTSVDEVRQLCT